MAVKTLIINRKKIQFFRNQKLFSVKHLKTSSQRIMPAFLFYFFILLHTFQQNSVIQRKKTKN